MQKRRIVNGSSTLRSKIRKTIKADQENDNNVSINIIYCHILIRMVAWSTSFDYVQDKFIIMS